MNFYTAFQVNLIETLTKEKFADLYAQTIAYGLFAAWLRMHRLGEQSLKVGAWKYIPESVPLLREIFYSFVGPDFPASLTWIIDDVAEMLEHADVASIYEEFKLTKWEEDPVIHFYETFLATYNPEERQRLGVYYTSLPVVSYIVRGVHEILKTDFGYEFRNNERFKFFLTNALEMKEPEQRALPLTNLIKEAEEAKEVKEKIPVLVYLRGFNKDQRNSLHLSSLPLS